MTNRIRGMAIALLVSGLAAAAGAQPLDGLAKSMETACEMAKANEYKKDGHHDTTYTVALLAGLDEATATRLALFSQAPDDLWLRFSAPAVGVWGFAWPPYRHKIVSTLHSLHGGDHKKVMARREGLAAMIAGYDLSDASRHWEVGFLIHALGDAHAHVYGPPGQLAAYGEFIGHVLDNGDGHTDPDDISKHRDHYEAFVKTLYGALLRNKNPAAEKGPEPLVAMMNGVFSTLEPSSRTERAMKFVIAKYCGRRAGADRTGGVDDVAPELSLAAVNRFLERVQDISGW